MSHKLHNKYLFSLALCFVRWPKKGVFLLLCAMMGLLSCKERRPSGILSEGKMEEVLYEYHLVRAIAGQSGDSAEYRKHQYTSAVLCKFNISQAEFDSSLVWYSQRTEKLYAIYSNIDKRLEKEARLLGVQTSPTSGFDKLSDKGDTANVWKGQNFYRLTACAGDNLMTFSIKTDTSYHANDRLMWRFNSKFVYYSGAREAFANLSVYYDNDSVASFTQRIAYDDETSISMTLAKRKVKRIDGFIFHSSPWDEKPKLMLVSKPMLIRFHEKIEKPIPADTLKVKTDSISDVSQQPATDTIQHSTEKSLIHSAPMPKRKAIGHDSFIR